MGWIYPAARRVTHLDNYHGYVISDPYRWLEDPDSPEVQAWIDAQNNLSRQFIDSELTRGEILQRLKALVDFPRYSAGFRSGSHCFFDLNNGLQDQAVMYQQDDNSPSAHVVMDPNAFSADGTVALVTRSLTDDGGLMAYGLASSGSDRQIIRVRQLEMGYDYPETLEYCRFATIAWKKDKSGFFYDRYPAPDSSEDPYRYNRVYWHNLDTPQSEDLLVYEQPDAPDLFFAPIVTHDEQYLVLHVGHGAIQRNRIYYRPLNSGGPFVRLLNDGEAKYDFIGSNGSTFYFLTDKNSPHGRIVAIDVETPGQWREIVPESSDTLAQALLVGGCFIAAYLHDAYHQLRVFELDGTLRGDITLPDLGTVVSLTGQPDHTEAFIGFTSFLRPTTIYRYDLNSSTLSVFKQSPLPAALDQYEMTQVFCHSKDGTRIPIFLVQKKGLVRNGANPTLLDGYGGYSVNMTPTFDVTTIGWLELGGIYAEVVLRGGAEYGESWHRAGMLAQKLNVFDDFCAAGEWLIANGYTRPGKLAITGSSNGGLLVAACMLQRPDLFGAVICGVPVIDMLRFHKFTAGRYWTPEYGDPDNPAHFPFMIAYSPLHNVRAGMVYPPILILTADHDDRVVPMHSLKFAATLQAQASDINPNPVLLRVDVKAGHGLGKPISKRLDELADILAFLHRTLSM